MIDRMEDWSGPKMIFLALVILNPLLIFLDISRYEDPWNSIYTRIATEAIFIVLLIVATKLKSNKRAKFQAIYFMSSAVLYAFLLISDYVIQEGRYELFVPNATTILLVVNASFIGLRFRHSTFLNAMYLLFFFTYATTLSAYPLHAQQLAYLGIFATIITILAYLFERKNREVFLNSEFIAQQKNVIQQKNNELEKQNEMKTTLISILSHDIKAPLNALQSLLSLKSEQLITETEVIDHFNKIGRSVTSTNQFVSNMILWIRTQMKGFNVKKDKFNVSDAVQQTIEFCQSLADLKRVGIDSKIDPTKTILSDKEMLSIALRNVLTNAIKFSHPGSTVTINEVIAENSYVIQVQDSGLGIPEEKKGSLFTIDSSSTLGTNHEGGTGLGLPLSYNLMKELGGDLTFVSQENHGSTFSLVFDHAID